MEPTFRNNALEKKRRDVIKNSFDDLKNSLPGLKDCNARVSRERILREAIAFIRDAKASPPITRNDVVSLQNAIAALQKKDGFRENPLGESDSHCSDESSDSEATETEGSAGTQLDDSQYSDESSDSETTDTSEEDESSDYENTVTMQANESSDYKNAETNEAGELPDYENTETMEAGELPDSKTLETLKAACALLDGSRRLDKSPDSENTKTVGAARGRPKRCKTRNKKQMSYRRLCRQIAEQ